MNNKPGSEGRIHVLAIGIDDYAERPLHGCVNDVDRVGRWLIDTAGVPAESIVRLTAARSRPEHEVRATRAAVLSALDDLASERVGARDRVLIFYAGHGRRDILRVRGKAFAREALVTCDDGPTDAIYDWEINARLAAIARRTLDVTVVLDCCHAAGVVRGENSARARRMPGRSIELAEPPSGGAMLGARGVGAAGDPSLRDLLVLTACHEHETAAECSDASGQIHGVFTKALVDALESFDAPRLGALTWSTLWPLVLDAADSSAQRPWHIGDLGRNVLGGGRARRSPGLLVSQRGSEFLIGAGTLINVTEGAQIGVYGATSPRFFPIDSPEDREARIQTLVVTKATRHASTARPVDGPFVLPDGARGRLVSAGKRGRVRVHVDPRLSARVGPLLRNPMLYERVDERRHADAWLELAADEDAITLRDATLDGIPREGSAREYAGARVPLTIEAQRIEVWVHRLVEHYAEYVRPIHLAQNAFDLPGSLSIAALDCSDDEALDAIDAQCPDLPAVGEVDGVPTVRLAERYCFRVENRARCALKVALLECGVDGAVLYHGDTMVDAGATHVFWSGEILRYPFTAGDPPGLCRIVAIGTTDETANIRHLECATTFADCDVGADPRRTRQSRTEHAWMLGDRWTGVVSYLDTLDLPRT